MSQLFAAMALAAVAAGPLLAHEGATGVVKERMDAMEEMGRAVKRIAVRLKSKRNFPAIRQDAQAIRAAAEKIPSLFPRGSGGGHSDTTAAVWERWPEFVAAAALLAREAEKLDAVVQSGAEPDIAAQFRAVMRWCSDCHDAFRSKQ
jgi:cytochrome c556